MKDSHSSTDESQRSAPNLGDRALFDEAYQAKIQQEIQDVSQTMSRISNHVEDAASSVADWGQQTFSLLMLEAKLNLKASKQLFVLGLFLFCITVLFVFSLCVSIGLSIYFWLGNPYFGLFSFLLSLGICIGLMLWRQQTLISYLGFSQTKQQLEEAWDVIVQNTTSSNQAQTTRKQNDVR